MLNNISTEADSALQHAHICVEKRKGKSFTILLATLVFCSVTNMYDTCTIFSGIRLGCYC